MVKAVFGSARCKSCDATGVIYHDKCGGAGTFPCLSCAALGYLPDCDFCGGKAELLCSACYGSGMAPGPQLLKSAASGPLGGLLRQLPVVQQETVGEQHKLPATIHRILSFLAFYHWSGLETADDGEHELFVQKDRLHFRVSLLSMGASTTTNIDYHFLNVVRATLTGYRVSYTHQRKAWR